MELNKKLAEWAGFEFDDDWSDDRPYKSPDGVILHNWKHFTESLDTCFKWLVPKVVNGDIHIETYTTDEETAVTLMRACDTVAWACDKSPALALCKAIERLIDG